MTTDQITPEAAQADDAHTPETPATGATDATGNQSEPDTFPRVYVEQLRDEAARWRTKAQTAETLAQRLHVALVAATGRLADPTDLAFDQAHLDDPEVLSIAIDQLLATKPHLASRTPHGDIGLGPTVTTPTPTLAGILRANAQ